MPRSVFSRQVTVPIERASAWEVITDVSKIVLWISVIHSAEVVVPLDRYTAVLEDRLGALRLKADLDVRVPDHRVGEYLKLSASGEDRQVRSRITIEGSLVLKEAGPTQTEVLLDGSYDISGKVAAMGAATIRRKADLMLDEFVKRLGSVE